MMTDQSTTKAETVITDERPVVDPWAVAEEIPQRDPIQEEASSASRMESWAARIRSSNGKATFEGLSASLKNIGDSVGQSTKRLSNSTKQLFQKSIQSIKSNLDVDEDSDFDIFKETEEEALDALKFMVEDAKNNLQQSRPQKWNFATAPLLCFEKKLDDVLMAFIRWAKVMDAQPHLSSTTNGVVQNGNNNNLATSAHLGHYNVTKAFRRLTAYATWMDNTHRDMIDPPLTSESIAQTWKLWNLKISYDKAGHMVVWFDMEHADVNRIKQIPLVDSLRLFVWLSHFIMFDPHVHQHGIIVVETLGSSGFFKTLNILQPKLAMKLDRLTIGTMPVHVKQIYTCEGPSFAKLAIAAIKPFIGRTVRERIVTLENPKLLEAILGKDCIPVGFSECDGVLEQDVLWATYFANVQ